ncbi:methyltransferase [Micromonospora haikouensis]|uniref:methyltransferase n=1 Tax=Micromonospora haikouensis TaxID=686309 RepID=UPI0036D0E599
MAGELGPAAGGVHAGPGGTPRRHARRRRGRGRHGLTPSARPRRWHRHDHAAHPGPLPRARVTLVDLDPALLALARASLGDRAVVLAADLARPDWPGRLPHRDYDAVLTANALHWLPAERLTELYGELRDLLRPGGLFVNADRMPDDALPTLTDRLTARARERRAARYAAGAALSWSDWWARAGADPVLGPLVRRRHEIYPTGHSPEWNPPVSWHLGALTAAGFTEAGTLWRGGADAAVAALR